MLRSYVHWQHNAEHKCSELAIYFVENPDFLYMNFEIKTTMDALLNKQPSNLPLIAIIEAERAHIVIEKTPAAEYAEYDFLNLVIVNQTYSEMALSKVNNSENTDLDQERYLRDATRIFSGIEKPLKYGPTIDTLNDLISALHREFETSYVNIEMVNHIMLMYQSNQREWKRFAKFDRYKYTRNLVDAGNGKFNLMILCWGEGQASAIHDHSDSHCFMKMLKGELSETRYEMPGTKAIEMPNVDIGEINGVDDGDFESEELKEVGKTTIGVNDVAYINDNLGLHRVENPSYIETAVSLHLYCPPFDECSVFHKNSGKRIKCPVTFWSKYGVRQVQS